MPQPEPPRPCCIIGPRGERGERGPIGPQGIQGLQGLKGDTGATGLTGPQGIQGITGPMGPQGVEGTTGQTGPMGPRGFQGNDGPEGPQGIAGPTGATGPMGPAGPTGLNTYGGLYHDTCHTITLIGGIAHQVSFNHKMPKSKVKLEQNVIEIEESGEYEINWKLDASASIALALSMMIRRNGHEIPSTTLNKTVFADLETLYSGSTIVRLEKGDKIDMALQAFLAVTLNLGTGTNATLSVKKLNS